MVALGEGGRPHHAHAPGLDARVVLVHREGVHVQALVEEAHAARADGWVFLEVHDVLVNHAAGRRIECPCVAKDEGCVRTLRQLAADDLIEALFTAVVHFAHGGREAFLHGRTGHERVEGRLACARLFQNVEVVTQHFLGLRGEVKDHVHVQRGERARGRRLAHALGDCGGIAVLLVAVHLAQQPVVEALHAHRQTLNLTGEALNHLGHEVVGVGLARHLGDGEGVARAANRLEQLVGVNRGRAAADVERVEVVAQARHHLHLGTQVREVAFRAAFLERKAVEAAVRAQALAEGHVHVEHVLEPGLGRGQGRVFGRDGVEGKIAAVHRAHDAREYAFGEHVGHSPRDYVEDQQRDEDDPDGKGNIAAARALHRLCGHPLRFRHAVLVDGAGLR